MQCRVGHGQQFERDRAVRTTCYNAQSRGSQAICDSGIALAYPNPLFWVTATEQRALASRRCELANCFAKVASRRHCECAAFGAILRPYLQGQTHRKVGAQSFRSKGCGLGQRGCRGRSAISLYSESHSRSVSSHSLTSPPKPDAARGACARAVTDNARDTWGKLAGHRGVEVQDRVSQWIHPLFPVLAVVFLVSGCLSDGSSSSAVQSARSGGSKPISGDDPPAVDNPPVTTNSAPRIQGKPPRNVVAGQQYLFKPKASDPDGDPLRFQVHNLPSWATFDSVSGRISGKPTAADVGSYKAIVVTVTDGKAEARLPEFAVAVVQTGDASVTLSWEPPTENTDGTPLRESQAATRFTTATHRATYSTTIPDRQSGYHALRDRRPWIRNLLFRGDGLQRERCRERILSRGQHNYFLGGPAGASRRCCGW